MKKSVLLAVVFVWGLLALAASAPATEYGPNSPFARRGSGPVAPVRFPNNPLAGPDNLPPVGVAVDYDTNFASARRMSKWLKTRIEDTYGFSADYIMPVGNHHGDRILLLFSKCQYGPFWSYAPGSISLDQVLAVWNTTTNSTSAEVGAPEIYINDNAKEVWMYFKRRVNNDAPNKDFTILTSFARSKDGIKYTIEKSQLGTAYMRYFQWDGYFFFVDRQGQLWRSANGRSNLQPGPLTIGQVFTNTSMVNGDGYTGLPRHFAVLVDPQNGYLNIFATRIGDAPERILYTRMALHGEWTDWYADPDIIEVMRPETVYEGAHLPNVPSVKGSPNGMVNQLRDPFVMFEDGQCLLYYSAGGESYIAGATIDRAYCRSK